MQYFPDFIKSLDAYQAEDRPRRAQVRGKRFRVFQYDAVPAAVEYHGFAQVPVENRRLSRRQGVLHSQGKLPR